MSVTAIRQANETYHIKLEENIFVCIFKDLNTNKFGINFMAPSEFFVSLMEDMSSKDLGVGGLLSKENVKELIKFLQDFVEGKI